MLSIITPNLNNAKYLEGNILSILSLTIPFEHIIVDGGSNDGSLELISKYSHIKLLNQKEKSGMYGAIDQGFNYASGEFITWVNADDRIISTGYEAMYKEISKGTCDFIYSDGIYHYIKENYEKLVKGVRFGKFFLKNGLMPTMQPSSIYTKKIYDKIGGLNFEKFKLAGDLDLFLRIALLENSVFKYIKSSSIIFMKRGDSLSDLNNDVYKKELKDNRLPIPNLLVRIIFYIYKHI